MRLTEPGLLILQVHATRKCNRRCLHGCSSSGTEHADAIHLDVLRHAIAEAAELGYKTLSVSGGEPLLYSGLVETLAEARIHGLETTLQTNGLLLSEARIAALQSLVDMVAINLEDVPNCANRTRPVDGVLDAIQANLSAVRAAKLPFSVVFTLTRDNFGELPWVADFACNQGAAMLEVRPMERVGHGPELADLVPTDKGAALAWLMVELLRQRHHGELPIRFDMYDRGTSASPARKWLAAKPLVPSPLVIETDGTVVPFRYGFPRRFAVGNVNDGSLVRLLRTWESRCGEALREIARETVQQLSKPRQFPFVNFYEHLCQQAEASTLSTYVGEDAEDACWQTACCG